MANDKYLNRNNRLIKKLCKKENYFEEIFENFDLIFLLTLCYFMLICENKKSICRYDSREYSKYKTFCLFLSYQC